MPNEMRFSLIELESLTWPPTIQVPQARFRLFVAADLTHISTDAISDFASSALKNGMVYFCAWGPDCERFHDIVDELIVSDHLGDRVFAGARTDKPIMTTWHSGDTLDEALDFFINLAQPADGLETDSYHWLAMSLDNREWTAEIRSRLSATRP